MSLCFQEYRSKIDQISVALGSDARVLALMLLDVERQVPSCAALQHRLGIDLQQLFVAIDRLWLQLSSPSLTESQLITLRNQVFSMVSLDDVPDARSALPTVGVALNTGDAVLKIVDFLLRRREDSFVMCAQCCLEAVREEVYGELYRIYADAKGSSRLLAERNSFEYANAIDSITQSAFSDRRTQLEITAQLSLAEEVLRISGNDRVALLKTREIALLGGINSLGFARQDFQ
jgi:hypothetical protein